jgi:Ca2+-binding RTX toxin-like protein
VRCFEPREHGVEGVGELAELVLMSFQLDPVRERSGRCQACGVGDAGGVPVVFDGGEGQDTTRYDGRSGDDQIAVALDGVGAEAVSAPGSATLESLATVESLIVSGRDGNDTIAGSNGLSALAPLTIDGGSGNDTARLGAGDDAFQWDPGDGSDVVEGQAGDDSLRFNGSNIGERIELSANGPRLRLTRDVAATTMDIRLDLPLRPRWVVVPGVRQRRR